MFELATTKYVGWPRHLHGRRAEGNQSERGERERQREKRRESINETIRSGRRHVFLKKEFQAVGQRLEQSVRADAVRPPARLDARDDFALEPGQVSQRRHHHEQQDGDFN